jgi:hypothetical protein
MADFDDTPFDLDLCDECTGKVTKFFLKTFRESRDRCITPTDEAWGKAHGIAVSPKPIPKPVTSAPCQVCAYLIRSDESEGLFHCERCERVYHEPCYWRLLPVEDFLTYWRWLDTAPHSKEHPEYVCAACKAAAGA